MNDAGDIPSRIEKKLRKLGYRGEIEITAVVAHKHTFTNKAAEALVSKGVRISHFDIKGEKDLADFIIMDLITKDVLPRVPEPTTLFVISGDYRFVDVFLRTARR
ncbi:hypothetical protein Bca4012_083216 [Brassica carinata]|uniref:NYN domain-containing protein n=1 Tax=Brassica carinata TaxID=52824 RepID=A0A8X7VAQ2_BRACI|nr:hypothetical protein Bca52824_027552 [Brassica carinata]